MPHALDAVQAWAVEQAARPHGAVLRLLHVVRPQVGVRFVCLPVARGQYHGFYAALGRETKHVTWWVHRLRAGGHAVVSGCQPAGACQAILEYLAPEM